MSIKIITYTLPTFWAVPLMYGDYWGLNEEEQKGVENFIKDNPNLSLESVDDDVHFMSWHDATQYNVLPTEVCAFHFSSNV